jgi:hypothetical protein
MIGLIMDRLWHQAFVVGTLLGLLVLAPLHCIWIINSPWFDKPPKPVGDGLCYEAIAFSLYSGNGFRENYESPQWQSLYAQLPEYQPLISQLSDRNLPATGRPPLLPAVIAGVYSLLGRTAQAFGFVRLLSSLCLALSSALAVGLTAQLLAVRTRRIWVIGLGALTTLALASSQNTIRDYASDFLTEPLALLLTQSLVVLVVLEVERSSRREAGSEDRLSQSLGCTGQTASQPRHQESQPTWKWLAAVGLIIGLMILARSLFVIWLPGLLALGFIASPGSFRVRIKMATTILTFAMMPLAPWWLHNCLQLGQWMPLGTQGPVALLGGYSDEALANSGNWSVEPERRLRARVAVQQPFIQATDDLQRELLVVTHAKRELRQWLSNHWRQLPQLLFQRAMTHWNPYSGRSGLWKLLIAIGLIWAALRAPGGRVWLVGLPLLSTVSVMLLYETGGRFLVPLYGLLFTLAGLAVSGWWTKTPKKNVHWLGR